MTPFTEITGTAAPLLEKGKLMSNVDTDMIIPKQFLKTTERTGLSKGLFYELKTLADGSPNPDFVLNKPEFAKADILIAGENFGCGSSREHAPWALADQGISVVISPSFADIFHNNCYKNGILPVRLPADDKRRLFDAAARQGRSANDLVREAIRREVGATRNSAVSPLAAFFGSVDSAPPAPTNAAVRRSMRRGRK